VKFIVDVCYTAAVRENCGKVITSSTMTRQIMHVPPKNSCSVPSRTERPSLYIFCSVPSIEELEQPPLPRRMIPLLLRRLRLISMLFHELYLSSRRCPR
jgi:hypothetical protein